MSNPIPSPIRLPSLALRLGCLAALVAGCSTPRSGNGSPETGSAAGPTADVQDAVPMRVTLRDFSGGLEFELVNPAHTDPVSYYSSTRRDAARKVVSTEIVAALIEYLRENGLEEHAEPGRLSGVGASTRGFEIEGPGGRAHWSVTDASPADERVAMAKCTQSFLDTYNLVTSYQTIDNDAGSSYFDRFEGRLKRGGR